MDAGPFDVRRASIDEIASRIRWADSLMEKVLRNEALLRSALPSGDSNTARSCVIKDSPTSDENSSNENRDHAGRDRIHIIEDTLRDVCEQKRLLGKYRQRLVEHLKCLKREPGGQTWEPGGREPGE